MKLFRLALIFFFFSLAPAHSYAQAQIVRVAVLTNASQIKLAVRSPYQVVALNTNTLVSEGRRHWWAREVVPTDSGIKIGKDEFSIYGLRIQPERSPTIYINGRKFRGAIDIIRRSDKTLLVINRLDIEEYIQGVMYHEVNHRWPMEALKAQAIAARTYALHQSTVNRHKDYDLVSTAFSQVYGGRTSEKRSTSKAVRLSKGKVLTYKNKIFPSFYHAACAGHTEDASLLWNINIPPLRGRECRFCRDCPHFKWNARISLQDIEEALRKAGFKIGTIEAINIVEKDISGRVTDLEVVSTQGTAIVSANRFRLAVGPNIIRSANFTLDIKRAEAGFSGYGWGHGVGMCQWGAFFMAKDAFNAGQILGYYYPQAKIKDIEEIRDAEGKIETF